MYKTYSYFRVFLAENERFEGPDRDSGHSRAVMFWGLNLAVLAVMVTWEILSLYWYGVKNAVKAAICLDLNLVRSWPPQPRFFITLNSWHWVVLGVSFC